MNPEKPDLEFYSIFCGVFLYERKKGNGACVPWTDRIPSAQDFYDYVGRTYYQNYFNNIFKDPSNGNSQRENSFLEHNTLGGLITKPFCCEVPLSEKVNITIPYFDCFLFSDGIGIFCFKVHFADGQKATYQNISQLLGYLRNPLSTIIADNNQSSISQFIQEHLEAGHQLPVNWNQYVNQLKSYTVINDPLIKRFTEEEDKTLFELSHTMPGWHH